MYNHGGIHPRFWMDGRRTFIFIIYSLNKTSLFFSAADKLSWNIQKNQSSDQVRVDHAHDGGFLGIPPSEEDLKFRHHGTVLIFQPALLLDHPRGFSLPPGDVTRCTRGNIHSGKQVAGRFANNFHVPIFCQTFCLVPIARATLFPCLLNCAGAQECRTSYVSFPAFLRVLCRVPESAITPSPDRAHRPGPQDASCEW